MDHLFLNTIAFPVRRGSLFLGREDLGEYRWEIEIHCGEPSQLESYDRADDPYDVLVGAEPSLYAQMLPLRANSPHELVGREYAFPQCPDDDGQDWPTNLGWPFFVIYLWEHCPVGPSKVTFTERVGDRYRVEIASRWFDSGVLYDLRVGAWLDWQGPEA